MEKSLPAIPAKRYFTIGEVSELCAVKPYVLRYWEQEFTQLKPMKRRGNRRYYQHHEVLLVRRIRELLYDHGFTISGARNRLGDAMPKGRPDDTTAGLDADADIGFETPPGAGLLPLPQRLPSTAAAPTATSGHAALTRQAAASASTAVPLPQLGPELLRAELLSIRELLDA